MAIGSDSSSSFLFLRRYQRKPVFLQRFLATQWPESGRPGPLKHPFACRSGKRAPPSRDTPRRNGGGGGGTRGSPGVAGTCGAEVHVPGEAERGVGFIPTPRRSDFNRVYAKQERGKSRGQTTGASGRARSRPSQPEPELCRRELRQKGASTKETMVGSQPSTSKGVSVHIKT